MSKKLTPLNDLKRKPTSLRQLFSSPKRWHKGSYGIGKYGKSIEFSCDLRDLNPTCLCLMGALIYIYDDEDFKGKEIRKYICNNSNEFFIVDFNDSPKTTFEDIKKLVNDLSL